MPPTIEDYKKMCLDRAEADGDSVMSNFDHGIDHDMAARLQSEPLFSRHAGWNFNGIVWWQDGQWHECVSVYHNPQKVFSAATLRELMEMVNDEFGSE